MNKKKIAALIVVGAITLGVIGGTLAWFTAKDDITNIFKTGSVSNPEDGMDAGIKVDERFLDKNGDIIQPDADGNYVYNTPVTPNETITKNVWIRSTANYDQIVRARIIKKFIDIETGNEVTHWTTNSTGKVIYGDNTLENGQPLNLNYIILLENLNGVGAPVGWTIQLNPNVDTSNLSITNWYYYNKVLKPENIINNDDLTSNILNTVTLSKDAGNEYKNLRFDVKVEGESIQASNGAINDDSVWQDVPQNIKDLNQ